MILLSQTLLAQVKTEAYFGVSGRTDAAKDIMELYDKGIYISGGFEGEPYHFSWNIKTDINLEFIYDKVMEHDLSTVAQFASASDDNGNIYIAGFTTYPDQWPFVTKLDSCGNKAWCKILQYDTEFEDGAARDILISNDNKIIVLADYDSEEEIDKVHLIGLNENGEVLWIKPYASKTDHPWMSEPNGYRIKEINDDYYISGFCYWPYPDDTTHYFLRPLFIGIDSLFDEKWILPFAPLDSVFGDAFQTVPINDTVLMGVGIRRASNSANEDNAILMFYNTDGEELGYNEIYNDQIGPDIKGSDIRNIVRINENLFMTSSQFGPEFSANPLGELIIDTAGNVYDLQSHPNTSAWIPGLIKTYDNNYVISLNIEETKGDDDIYVYKIDENLNDVPFDPTPHTYDSLCPGGIQSGAIDLTSCFVWTDVSEAPSPGEYYSFIQTIPVKVYPNPATEGSVTFEFENTEHHRNMELRCFNVYGEIVHSERIYRYQEKTEVNVSGWREGMYFGVVYSGGKAVGRCKFVIQ